MWASSPYRKLTLLLEMKLPGAGVLEFEIVTTDNISEVRATAYFHPAGYVFSIWGLIYLTLATFVIWQALPADLC